MSARLGWALAVAAALPCCAGAPARATSSANSSLGAPATPAATLATGAPATPEDGLAGFSATEVRRLLQHSPLGAPPPDETNAWADDAAAARLGQALFFDARLSLDGSVSCATCHDPARGFGDARSTARGLGDLARNAPTLWNVAWQRWYFWDGRSDTLWGQVFGPLENPLEMGSSRTALARRVALDAGLAAAYREAFGAFPAALAAESLPEQARPVPQDAHATSQIAWESMPAAQRDAASEVALRAAKAIAAYERRLVSARAPFDRFVEGLRENDAQKIAALSPAAQRGAKLFVGRAGCRACHSGPNFSDGEFHDIGVAPLGGGRPTDAGRFEGIERLLSDPFNSASAASDGRSGSKAQVLASLARGPQSWGEFKTPTLRNLEHTAPYMHQGQMATLEDVLHYYSTLEGMMPAGHHAETILVPLSLDEGEFADLRAFLGSLSEPSDALGLDPELLAPPP